jgi:hypothetical protein
MKQPFRRTCAAAGALLGLGVLLACGSSQQQSPGVTNVQPENTNVTPYQQQVGPTKAPVREGACIDRGEACTLSTNCCSQWCANGVCAVRQP